MRWAPLRWYARIRMRLPPNYSRSIRTLRFSRAMPSRSCPCCLYRAPRGVLTMPNTVRLHRVISTRPDKIYRAFIEPDAMAKWLPPNGFTCTVHHLEPTVGGSYRMSFRNFTTGQSHSFGGEYVELLPGVRLRYTDKFEDPNLPGEIRVTVTLKGVLVGTELNIVQEGLPDAIPVEACYLGWQESLRNLAKLVEPDIIQ